MRKLVFTLIAATTLLTSTTTASATPTLATVDAPAEGPTTVIVDEEGNAHYTEDGNDCTINMRTGRDYGPDC